MDTTNHPCEQHHDTEYVVTEVVSQKWEWFKTMAEAQASADANPHITKITEHHVPCGECNVCSTFCDVCGSWYSNDEPCEFH